MRDRILTAIVVALVAAFSFGATASAASAAAPEDGSLLDLAKPVFSAVMNGHGWLAAALALVLVVAASRRYLPKWFPSKFGWLTSDAGTTLATFLLSLGGAFSTAFAAGASPSFAVAKMAMVVALGAAGGYQALKHLVAPLLRALRDKLPTWARPGVDVVLWIFERPSSVEKAETAGDAAVAANPPTGAAGVVGESQKWPPQ